MYIIHFCVFNYNLQDGYVSYDDFSHFMLNFDDDDYEENQYQLTDEAGGNAVLTDQDLDNARDDEMVRDETLMITILSLISTSLMEYQWRPCLALKTFSITSETKYVTMASSIQQKCKK